MRLCALILAATTAALAAADARARTPERWANATAYCLHGTMRDGTYTRPRSAAVLPGALALGTRIRVTSTRSGPRGMRRYVVRDWIGYGSTLDLWVDSCGDAIAFGRRSLSYKLGWGRPRR